MSVGFENKIIQRERLATLGQLLSGIAHELNNPLTAVTGYAELLLADRLPASQRRQVEMLAEEADRASRILRSLLLFARGEPAERKPVNLNELLERTLALRAYELKVQNIRVVTDFAPDLSPVLADSTGLQQVFLNLLLNAEQAIRSQRQHGQIAVRSRSLRAQRQVEIAVVDDGPGIPPALQPHLFDAFFTTKSGLEGTGMGLSISQAIAKNHGGAIRVESQPGHGATFYVVLPAGLVPQPSPPAFGRTAVARSDRVGVRVLVVDDEPVIAHLMADTLRRQGFRVHLHTDSRRALEDVARHDYDLLICDVRMPDLDGPAFYRLLQQRHPQLLHRLLFTTGDTLARDTARFLEEVQLPCLAKPFHVEELLTAVDERLRSAEPTPSQRAGP